jgi:hypothetical protein
MKTSLLNGAGGGGAPEISSSYWADPSRKGLYGKNPVAKMKIAMGIRRFPKARDVIWRSPPIASWAIEPHNHGVDILNIDLFNHSARQYLETGSQCCQDELLENANSKVWQGEPDTTPAFFELRCADDFNKTFSRLCQSNQHISILDQNPT